MEQDHSTLDSETIFSLTFYSFQLFSYLIYVASGGCKDKTDPNDFLIYVDTTYLDDSIVYMGTVKAEAEDDADVPVLISPKKEDHHDEFAGSQQSELHGSCNIGMASNVLVLVQTTAAEAHIKDTIPCVLITLFSVTNYFIKIVRNYFAQLWSRW